MKKLPNNLRVCSNSPPFVFVIIIFFFVTIILNKCQVITHT